MIQMQTVHRITNQHAVLPENFQISVPDNLTPEAVKYALEESRQLSSPVSNHLVEVDENIQIKHKLSDRQRLLDLRENTVQLKDLLAQAKAERENFRLEWENRMETNRLEWENQMETNRLEWENERENNRLEREKERNLVLCWEVYARVAQHINDELLRELDSSSEQILFQSQVQYLPLLLIAWYFKWSGQHELPRFLNDLPETIAKRFKNPKFKTQITAGMENAIIAPLMTNFPNKCLVMMMCFAYRPQDRVPIAHPVPTASFASSYICSSPLFEDESSRTIALAALANKELFEQS